MQGRYFQIHSQARRGSIYFVTLQLISTMRASYCGKEKIVSEGHSTFVAKQIQVGSLLDFITL